MTFIVKYEGVKSSPYKLEPFGGPDKENPWIRLHVMQTLALIDTRVLNWSERVKVKVIRDEVSKLEFKVSEFIDVLEGEVRMDWKVSGKNIDKKELEGKYNVWNK